MIEKIQLENFKIYKKKTDFSLSTVNILCGINGSGKSTLLQSMLLLCQSLDKEENLTKIFLNGSCINLGSFDDIRNTARENPILFTFTFKNKSSLSLILTSVNKDEMVAALKSIEGKENIEKLRTIHYIAADRLGPQEFFQKTTLPGFLSVGTKGECTGNVLLQMKNHIVSENLYIDELFEIKNLSQELETQTGVWLSKIFGVHNVKLRMEDVGNSIIIPSFLFDNSEKKFKPSNVGFGYSYVLPIIVSGLIAKPGESVIVENPEAHLHEGAQARLIYFLCKVAAGGIQVFIETHSEHILNATRLLIKKEIIKNEDLSILFFQDKKEEPVIKIEPDEDGGIDLWPDDFFDQNEKDMKQLLGF